MKRHTHIFFVIALLFMQLNNTSASAQSCAGQPVAVQILGSGGPTLNRLRASSSYLLWIDNRARVLIDLGGGAYLRFAEAGAKLSDLSLLAVTHLDPDHIAGLPALLWLSNRSRTEPLPTVGPSGNDIVPGYSTFLYRLFDGKNGAFQIMGSALGDAQTYSQQSVRLDVSVVDAAKAEPSTVYNRAGMTVTALGVPHGEVPTLAYRVQTHGVSIVIGSDQTGTNPAFVRFARGANVLIMHLTIDAGTKHPVHAAPDVVGQIAQEAQVGRLIVSHIGPIDRHAAISELKRFYSGPLTIGADLQCTQVR
ncbi:MAG: MBL fold metallo-hydrolase [Betaproteobacteria bacterium]|nr:MBL fold metallo-hydrolase [Betaproteobacteria bacterium]